MRPNIQFLLLPRCGSQWESSGLSERAGTGSARLAVRATVPSLLVALCLAVTIGRPTPDLAAEARDPAPLAELSPIDSLGSWIWDKEAHSRQTCRFWRSFEITNSTPVVRALLQMTVDNEYTLYFDGRQVGRGSDWRILTEYDLTWLLRPGTHVLSVDAFNNADTFGVNAAGLILGLSIHFADGSVMEVRSDQDWRVVPETERNWQTIKQAPERWRKVKVLGPVGKAPWWRRPLTIERVPPEQPIILQFWQTGWFQLTVLAVCGTVVLICLRLMAEVTVQAKAQQLLQLERARIARDIHDDLGAGLTKLVLQGEVAQSELQADSEARVQIGQLCEKARDLSHVVDEVVWAINSRRDTLRDFATYVCKYAQAFLSSTPIRCRLDVEPELPPIAFDLPIRRNLFLAVKEALNNAAKHSQASELFLRIHRRGEGLAVAVEDNGRGFDLAHASPDRNGVANMGQRMDEVGGVCRISGKPGTGCRIDFIVPRLHAQRPSRWRAWRLRHAGHTQSHQTRAEGAGGTASQSSSA
jgi:signal transduction histidine kinase